MLTYYGRRDAAHGNVGALNLMAIDDNPTVELVFQHEEGTPDFAPHDGMPNEDQMVLVNGVQRYFWVEYTAPLQPRPKLRRVKGRDLRRKDIRVITTDDGSRYAFLPDDDLDKAVADALPAGKLQAIVNDL